MSPIIDQIVKVTYDFIQTTGQEPTHLYLGYYQYRAFNESNEIRDSKAYAVHDPEDNKIIYRGMEVLEVLKSRNHIGVGI